MNISTIVLSAAWLAAQVAAIHPDLHSIGKTRKSVAHMRRNTTGSEVPSTQGVNFTIDGQQGYFPGTNSYWISYLTENSDVDTVLDHLQESGLRVLRIWGFSDVNSLPTNGAVYFQLLQNGVATINTGADGLQRLDYVVAAAEKRDIKLIINFVNNWSDYGGMNAYNVAFGGTGTSWYTTPVIQDAYRKYIKAVVSRYSLSPAIFAWELANEPRCSGCDTSVIYDWASSTSAYIKSLDPEHMVAIGDEGFGLNVGSDGTYPYTFAEGLDFAKNLQIDTIDFGTFHLYPSTWSVPNTFGDGWITAHAKACAAAHKPCLMEEYGVTTDKCTVEGEWQKTALDTKAISGDLFWQYGDKLSTGDSPNDNFTIYRGTEDYQCLIADHVAAV